MLTEFYKTHPVPGLRVCEKGEWDSLRSIDDVEHAMSEGIGKYN